ncbi:FAD-binding oxidoreductase [Streptomyces monticola]|uniref:FAD-binding oxidoreductase n=1 Tax=Streptomyces monticola TaxID=2666263 RepID=A0ABW2JXC4_9ACTN
MGDFSRRNFVRDAAVLGGAAVALPAIGPGGSTATAAAGAAETAATGVAADAPVTVRKGESRYPSLVSGANLRFTGSPDRIHVVSTADQVVQVVQEAVDAGQRIAVRSGGHCDENFTTSDGIRVVIDMAGMDAVTYDDGRGAFAVEPGARLGQVYRVLYKGWGVTIPGGVCPTVGAGGHIVGGGYGALSRRFGLTVDHLYGVEVVVVDAAGRAKKVVATREPDDPNRELWWAHTGAGGGNFGVITRYWLKSPGAGPAPGDQLPKPPSEVLVTDISWSWEGMTEAAFSRLLRNFSQWYEQNSDPGSAHTKLFSRLTPQHRSAGGFRLTAQLDASVPDAEKVLDAHLDAVNAGTGLTYSVSDRSKVPWLYAVTDWFGLVEASMPRWKAKSAYQRKAFTDAQLKALYRHLTRDDYANPYALVAMVGFGGQINAVDPAATAVAQRDSVLKLLYVSHWTDPADEPKDISWVRGIYRDVHAETGGVPRPGGVTDGCYINYPDSDLADPALNDSGVPWQQLYFKDNYGRLQQTKAEWDPRNLFTHALAIQGSTL